MVSKFYGLVGGHDSEEFRSEFDGVYAFSSDRSRCIGGDFNVLSFLHKRKGCCMLNMNMRMFYDWVNLC